MCNPAANMTSRDDFKAAAQLQSVIRIRGFEMSREEEAITINER